MYSTMLRGCETIVPKIEINVDLSLFCESIKLGFKDNNIKLYSIDEYRYIAYNYCC